MAHPFEDHLIVLRDLFCQVSGPAWRDFKRLVNISLKAERYRSIRGIGKTSVSDTHSKAIDLIDQTTGQFHTDASANYFTSAAVLVVESHKRALTQPFSN